ncbi:response regulator [Caulobacter sp. LARHSG274]
MRWLPDADDARPDAAGVPEDFGGSVEERPRVVLADDNADMRAHVKGLLEAGGYEVRAVSDGRAALEAALAGPPPDLVLSDVMIAGTGRLRFAGEHTGGLRRKFFANRLSDDQTHRRGGDPFWENHH